MRSGPDIDDMQSAQTSGAGSLPPPRAGVILFLILSVLLVRIPLLNYLGYEFSVAISLAVPWLIGVRAVRRFRVSGAIQGHPDNPDFRAPLLTALKEGWGLLLIPVATATANLLLVRNCSYGEGLLFFALIPGITVFWCVALAGLCVAATRKSRRLCYLLYAAAVLSCFVYPVWIGYFSPQIFSYDFIYGYFPGFSYDEVLRITPVFLLFRLLTILTGVLFLLVSTLLIRRSASHQRGNQPGARRLYVWSAIPGAVLIVAWAFRVGLGFETTTDSLERALPGRYSTEHFRIFYSPESISPAEIGWIAALHEYRYAEVEAALQVRFRGPVFSYIYPDGETKLRLIGTKTTNIAKPWRSEIHLEKNSLESTLKHELVHVIAGDFGLPVIKAHYNIGLVEGLAMAVDGDFGNRTLDQYASAIRKFKLVPDPGRLIRPIGFAMKASTVSYVLTGSFRRYLLGRYGIVLFRRLYGGKSPVDVYGKSYDELTEEWQSHLDRHDVPDSWRSHVEYYFNRPSIFAKECARTVALRNEEGYKSLSENDAPAAIAAFSSALDASWNSESYSGLIRASFSAARYDTVLRLVNARGSDSTAAAGFINLYVLYGDALWHAGKIDSARTAYQKVLAIDLSDGFDEAAAIRLTATADADLRTGLPEFAAGRLTDSSALRLLRTLGLQSKNPILEYLEGRILLRQKHLEEGISTLIPVTGTLEFPILNARAEQMIGEACYQSKKFQQARIHFWKSLNYITNEASTERVQEWVDRCEWFDRNVERYLSAR